MWAGVSWLYLGALVLGQVAAGGSGAAGATSAPSPEDRRERAREARRAYLEASPEERRELRVRRFVERMDRIYELSDEQTEQVRREIEKIQAEYEKSLGDLSGEYQTLMNDLADYWRKHPQDSREARREAQRDPELRRIRQRLGEIRRDHPFDMQAAVRRIEGLLPPEQVGAGHKRQEAFREDALRMREEERIQRREERIARREERRARRLQRQASELGGEPPTSTPAPASAESDSAKRPVVPTHPWRVYAEEFAEKHDLSTERRAAVESIVKQMLERERAYRLSKRDAYLEAEKLPLRKRDARIRELDAPIDKMFDELRTRLDDLLTARQKKQP
ncbi:MAG: hypothetical protein L6Q92_10820 [Phycisphaerae bacterium]|nr:hypothetical protein [Phycisphaerae bacterium]